MPCWDAKGPPCGGPVTGDGKEDTVVVGFTSNQHTAGIINLRPLPDAILFQLHPVFFGRDVEAFPEFIVP